MMFFLPRIKNKITKSLRISLVGLSFLDKIILFFICFWFPLKKKIGILPQITFRPNITLFDNSAKCSLYNHFDLEVFKEVFVDSEYDVNIKTNPAVIFDLGSNVGYTVIFFKLKYPQAKIYAFEPVPSTYKKLVSNTEQFGDSVDANQIAVTGSTGFTAFYIDNIKTMSSSIYSRNDLVEGEEIEVKSKKLADVIFDKNIDYIDLLKFDVEGAEEDIFKSNFPFESVGYLVGEAHYDLMNSSRKDFLSFFKLCNIISLVNHSNVWRERIVVSCYE